MISEVNFDENTEQLMMRSARARNMSRLSRWDDLNNNDDEEERIARTES